MFLLIDYALACQKLFEVTTIMYPADFLHAAHMFKSSLRMLYLQHAMYFPNMQYTYMARVVSCWILLIEMQSVVALETANYEFVH